MLNLKHQIRQSMSLKLATLTVMERQGFELQALSNLKPLLTRVNKIAIYHAQPQEFNLMPIIQFCLMQGIKLYQPVAFKNTRYMQLEVLDLAHAHTIFRKSGYIPQYPDKWYNMDMILLPVTAVDATGCRVGRGGGYYDTTLADISESVVLCGVGYQCQWFAGNLASEPFDKCLNYYVSEQALFTFT